MSRTEGISEQELEVLPSAAGNSLFSPREQAALAYAEAVTGGNEVADEVFARLRRYFSEEEIIELTATITWEICAAKFNRALEIEWGGACRLPPR